MATALTDRIVARYLRDVEPRQAEHPRLPVRRDEVHAGSLGIRLPSVELVSNAAGSKTIGAGIRACRW